LILLVTALACRTPSIHVLGLLRELLALSFGVTRVADLSDSYIRALSHAPTADLIGGDVEEELDWFTMAFEINAGGYRRASNREIAALLIAFGRAQQENDSPTSSHTPPHGDTYVRVRNLVGMESICAALTVMFRARIQVGPLMARSRRLTAHDGIKYTRIIFEYDQGEACVGVALHGRPIADYLVPLGSKLPPSPQTVTAGCWETGSCTACIPTCDGRPSAQSRRTCKLGERRAAEVSSPTQPHARSTCRVAYKASRRRQADVHLSRRIVSQQIKSHLVMGQAPWYCELASRQ
jgi:hypothetical protein